MLPSATRSPHLVYRTLSLLALAALLGVGAVSAQAITGFALYDADTDQQIRNLEGTDAIDLAALPTNNLTLVAFGAGGVESVRFEFAGQSNYRTENTPPYALGGDQNGDFAPVPELSEPGFYTVNAVPYSGANGTGTVGDALVLRLTVTDSSGNPDPPPPPSDLPAVTGFALYEATTGQQIRNLEGTDEIDLAALSTSALSIVAFTAGGAESVRFDFAGDPNYQTENLEPYSLAGDNNGTFTPVPELAQPGSYTLVATPYTGDNASGDAGDGLTLRLTVVDGGSPPVDPPGCVDGEGTLTYDGPRNANNQFMQWHPITITYDGPCASEEGTPNPFLDYRFDMVFTSFEDGTVSFRVPGYFAADGNAAETGATSGNKWRAHVTLPLAGAWSVGYGFREGPGIAVEPFIPTNMGEAIFVDPSNKCAGGGDCRDNRGKGSLRYVGERYLRFDNGEYFVKGGADSPENLLAYADFDNTFDTNGQAKTWEAHVQDWNPGDPTWQDGKGKGLIGALNYLAEEGMNAFSFLPFNNPLGDGRDVWPWTTPGETSASRLRYDVSKLAQWEIVFTHADSLGMFLHVKTQETENDQVLDGGALGTERRLYYRELVARFGHHLALNWNLGEENTNTDAQRRAFAEYFDELDPYDHAIVVHTFPGQYEDVYGDLLGDPHLTGASIQLSSMNGGNGITAEWLERSAAAGRPWHVAIDEPGNASTGVSCDGPGNNHEAARAEALWANLMAGGTGVEWYFGYQTCAGDLSAEDFRTRDRLWDYTRHALTFFREYLPFWEMAADDGLTADPDDYVFAKPGEVYAVYLPPGEASGASLSLPDGAFEVRWFDVRDGGALQTGTVAEVSGGGARALGAPPSNASADWVALVTADGSFPPPPAPPPSGSVVVAVNAGGPAYTSTDGVDFDADQAFSSGRTYANAVGIGQTPDDALYQTERYGDFAYRFQIPDGDYDVTLHFAEIYWSGEGQRVFDATAEGVPVVTDLDLVAEVGPRVAYRATQRVTVVDGQLDLVFSTDVNNAKVSAIEVRVAADAAAAQANADADLEPRAYPNPSNGTVTIEYGLAEAGAATLEVFDVIGRRVALLAAGDHAAGLHRAVLDGAGLAAGVYHWRLTTSDGPRHGSITLTQ